MLNFLYSTESFGNNWFKAMSFIKAVPVLIKEIAPSQQAQHGHNVGWTSTWSRNGYSENNGIYKHRVSMWHHFVTSFLWHSNSYVIITMLRDLHKITKSVTKFWIRIKRMNGSHMCPADSNKDAWRLQCLYRGFAYI